MLYLSLHSHLYLVVMFVSSTQSHQHHRTDTTRHVHGRKPLVVQIELLNHIEHCSFNRNIRYPISSLFRGGSSSWSLTYMALSTVVVLGPRSAGAVNIFRINCSISVLCHRKSHLLSASIAFKNEFNKKCDGFIYFFPCFFFFYINIIILNQIINVIFLSI